MAKFEKTIASMRDAPGNVSYADLHQLCSHLFGPPRQRGTSHAVFRTPWPGDPRVNIQRAAGGRAKPYQVRQVLRAIDKLREEHP